MGYLRYAFIFLWIAFAKEAIADTPPTTSAGTGQQPAAEISASQKVKAKVVSASGVSDENSLRLRLGDRVRLKVTDLSKAMEQHGELKPDQLRLYVNDIVMANVAPSSVDLANGIVIFPLNRNLASEEIWRVFYQFPYKYEHPSKLSIGSEITQIADPYPAGEKKISIELIREKQLMIGLVLVAVFAGVLFWLGSHHRLLKEDWSSQYNKKKKDASTVPFSLAKVQLAFWTFLIISGFFIIWLVTGETPTIHESLLALLGVSLSGKILGKGINFNQVRKGAVRVQDAPSEGFFRDILSDENGTSLARLQFLLFNLIIGASFIRNIVKNWSLMDIDGSSLVLLTISGAGYLIMKNTENSAAAPTPDRPGNAQPGVAPSAPAS